MASVNEADRVMSIIDEFYEAFEDIKSDNYDGCMSDDDCSDSDQEKTTKKGNQKVKKCKKKGKKHKHDHVEEVESFGSEEEVSDDPDKEE